MWIFLAIVACLLLLIVVIIAFCRRKPRKRQKYKLAKFKKWNVVACQQHPHILYRDLGDGRYESFQLHRFKKKKWWHKFIFWKKFRVDNPKEFIEIPDNPNPRKHGKGYVYKEMKKRPKNKYYENIVYKKWKVSDASKTVLNQRYIQRENNRKEQEKRKEENRKKRLGGTTSH